MPAPNPASKLLFDLDPAAITNLTDGSAVASLPDTVGGRNFVGGAASAQPTYRTNQLNGKPAVVFDGVNDVLFNSATGLAARSGLTIFAVMAQNSVPSSVNRGILSAINSSSTGNDFDTGNGEWNVSLTSSTAETAWAAVNVGGTISSTQDANLRTSSTPLGQFAVVALRVGASIGPRLQVNGALHSTGAAPARSALTLSRLNLGSRRYSGADQNFAPISVARVLVYDGKLGAADHSLVMAYLTSEYGTANASTVPSNRMPDSISGCIQWSKASDLPPSEGSLVASWPARVGVAVTQATASKQPTQLAAQNGASLVRFDGVDDGLRAAVGPGSGVPFTIFVVAKELGTTATTRMIVETSDNINTAADSAVGTFIVNTTGSTIAARSNSATNPVGREASDADWLTTGALQVVQSQFSGSTATDLLLYRNNSPVSMAAPTGVASSLTGPFSNPLNLGSRGAAASLFWPGDIAELIIYNRVLTQTERNTVASYLSDEYAITVADYTSGGTTPTGTAAGSWNFAGTAAGTSARSGTAAGTWSFAGAASGTSARSGTASGAWSFAGAATGSAPVVGGASGTAAGTWTFTGAASGTSDRSGTGAGTWTFTGAAVGAAPLGNTASGTWGFTGSATGARDSLGSATGTWSFFGTALGPIAPTFRFVPPTAPLVPPTVRLNHPGHSLFRHYRMWDAGINVFLLTDNTVTTVMPRDPELVAQTFHGGHIHTVNQNVATLLIAAGYTVQQISEPV